MLFDYIPFYSRAYHIQKLSSQQYLLKFTNFATSTENDLEFLFIYPPLPLLSESSDYPLQPEIQLIPLIWYQKRPGGVTE